MTSTLPDHFCGASLSWHRHTLGAVHAREQHAPVAVTYARQDPDNVLLSAVWSCQDGPSRVSGTPPDRDFAITKTNSCPLFGPAGPIAHQLSCGWAGLMPCAARRKLPLSRNVKCEVCSGSASKSGKRYASRACRGCGMQVCDRASAPQMADHAACAVSTVVLQPSPPWRALALLQVARQRSHVSGVQHPRWTLTTDEALLGLAGKPLWPTRSRSSAMRSSCTHA